MTTYDGGDFARCTAAYASIGAALIHVVVLPEHRAQWWGYGVAFGGLAAFQLLWGVVAFKCLPRAAAYVAVAVNGATVALWMLTRTAGLPVGPDAGAVEAAALPDIAATAFEITLMACVLWVVHRPATRARFSAALFLAALTVQAVAVSAVTGSALAAVKDGGAHGTAHNQGGHDHGEHEHGEHGHERHEHRPYQDSGSGHAQHPAHTHTG